MRGRLGSLSFIALHDLRHQLRQGGTIVWLLIMPPVFFYFLGTVTGGFSSSVSGADATPLVVEAATPGFLKQQVDRRLRDNDFAPDWRDRPLPVADSEPAPGRVLRFAADLTAEVSAGRAIAASYETSASSIARDFEKIRITRSLYTTLADIVVVNADGGISEQNLQALNARPRIWQLDVSAAGNRQHIPSGFEQTIPGILVMFTLLVLLTTGGTMLVVERKLGLLRRLASAPMTRGEMVSGKWGSRMLLAAVQVSVGGEYLKVLFRLDWGPSVAVVLLGLAAGAAFGASGGWLLGCVAG
jgi:hypothetical protein